MFKCGGVVQCKMGDGSVVCAAMYSGFPIVYCVGGKSGASSFLECNGWGVLFFDRGEMMCDRNNECRLGAI